MDSPVQIAGLFTPNPLGVPKPSGNNKKKNEKIEKGNLEVLNGNKIPHGLVVRIRAFHARGQGSIPCGGELITCPWRSGSACLS